MAHTNSNNNISEPQITEGIEIKSEIELTPTTIQHVTQRNNPPVSNFIVEEAGVKTETSIPEIDITPTTIEGLNYITQRNTQNQSQASHIEKPGYENFNVEVKIEPIKTEITDCEMDSTQRNAQSVAQESELIAAGMTLNNTPEVFPQLTLSPSRHDKLKTEITVFDIEIASDVTDFAFQTNPISNEFVSKENEMILPDKEIINLENFEKYYKCEKCHIGFLSHENYEMHMQCHVAIPHNSPSSSSSSLFLYHVCTLCYATFATEGGFIRHSQKKHDELNAIGKKITSPVVKVNEIESTSEKTKQDEQMGVENPGTEKDSLETRSRNNNQKLLHVGITSSACLKTPNKKLSSEKNQSDTFTVTGNLSHGIKDTGDKPFQCYFCDVIFTNKLDLKTHERTHDPRPYQCNMCSKTYTKSSHLNDHLKIHTGEKPFQCSVCNKTFRKLTTLKGHEKTHTGEKPFKCNICNMGLSTSYSLSKHLNTHAIERPYKCKLCDKGFNAASNLKAHERKHTGERPFVCNICSKAFYSNSKLNDHLKLHTGEKPFQCRVCNKRFTNQFNLKTHEKTHTGERPHKCHVCNMGFIKKDNLKRHFITHANKLPYQCQLCGQGFKLARDLEAHENKRTGERPYKCNICSKGYPTSKHLNEHLKTHSSNKPFQCHLCDKSYKNITNLKSHVSKHTKYNSFEYNEEHSTLKTHVKKQTEVNSFKCNICNKGFTRDRNLKTHLRLHTGETPYQCNMCDKAFAYNLYLKRHLKTHLSM